MSEICIWCYQLYPISSLQDITSLPFNSYQNIVVRNAVHQRLPRGLEGHPLFLGMLCFLPLRFFFLGSNQPSEMFILKTRGVPLLCRLFLRATCHPLVENGYSLYEDPWEKLLLSLNCFASISQILKMFLLTMIPPRSSEANFQTASIYSSVFTLHLVWFYFPPLISHCSTFIHETRNEGGWERSWR